MIADWNKTGNLGLGIQTGAPLGIAIEAGNDDGTFDAAGTAADPRFIFLPEQFVSADLNGDGLPDLVALVIDVVNGGTVSVFLNAGPSPPLDFVSVSAASAITAVAPSSIASIYAPFPFSVTQSNKSPSAPIQLAGVSVDVKDSAGVTRPAPLFYVSPTQVNLEIPSGTAPGVAAITVASGGPPVVGSALVQNVVPRHLYRSALRFPAAYAVTYGPDNKPGTPAGLAPEYAGPHGQFEGLDQINLEITNLPVQASSSSGGQYYLMLNVDGVVSNAILFQVE